MSLDRQAVLETATLHLVRLDDQSCLRISPALRVRCDRAGTLVPILLSMVCFSCQVLESRKDRESCEAFQRTLLTGNGRAHFSRTQDQDAHQRNLGKPLTCGTRTPSQRDRHKKHQSDAFLRAPPDGRRRAKVACGERLRLQLMFETFPAYAATFASLWMTRRLAGGGSFEKRAQDRPDNSPT